MKRSELRRSAKRPPRHDQHTPVSVAAFTRDVRELIFGRSGDRCEVQVTPECRAAGGSLTRVGRSIHHRRPRQMGGSRVLALGSATNGLAVCGSGTTGCHGYIEAHREEARAHGWLIGSWGDPGTVAVTRPDGTVAVLDDEGGFEVIFDAQGRPA